MKKRQVSERALEARIQRVLRKDYESLRRCRYDGRGFYELGRYYIVDDYRNTVIEMQCDLEHLGRELKVLRDYEELVTAG